LQKLFDTGKSARAVAAMLLVIVVGVFGRKEAACGAVVDWFNWTDVFHGWLLIVDIVDVPL
jgi:hypothetical protein